MNTIIYDVDMLPGEYYTGKKLEFGRFNYFIGVNGSLKTHLLWKLKKKLGADNFIIFSPGRHFRMGSEDFPTKDYRTQIVGGNEDARCKEFLHKDIEVKQKWCEFIKEVTGYKVSTSQDVMGDVKIRFDVRDLKGNNIEVQDKSYSTTGPGNGVSDGLKQLMMLGAYIWSDEFSYLGFDEPETNLHPQAIRYLLDAIASAGKGKYIFIATHSPFAIRIDDNYRYFFFYSDKNEIKMLLGSDLYGARHLFNYDQQRAFFWDEVLLVEGYTDQIILEAICAQQKWISHKKGIFQAMGTREINGKSNIVLAAEILYKAGKKIHVILDKNSSVPRKIQELNRVTQGSAKITALEKTDLLFYFFPDPTLSDKIDKALEIQEKIFNGLLAPNAGDDYYPALKDFMTH